MFQVNEGSTDRVIRALVAMLLAAVAYTYLSGLLQVVVFILASLLLFTALTGFCFLYTLIGINTCPVKKKR